MARRGGDLKFMPPDRARVTATIEARNSKVQIPDLRKKHPSKERRDDAKDRAD